MGLPIPGLGLRVVTIGGGTGMPILLRGLRRHTDNITAVVTVADDGGSSGRLRRQMGMLPPGDFRNNIAALSDAEELMTQLMQYRFTGGDELAGHSFGNLLITAMTAITGSFEAGIAESSRVLAVKGRVLPSTLEQVTLCAEIRRTRPDGQEEWLTVRGESQIPTVNGHIVQVYLDPQDVRAYPEVIRAILSADLIVAGPGSFYTSTIPNLLVPSLRQAIAASRAVQIFVCNIANQPGETGDFTVSDYVAQLRRYAGDIFPTVVANDRRSATTAGAPWVALPATTAALSYQLIVADLSDPEQPTHHDSHKLAALLLQICAAQSSAATESAASRTGPDSGLAELHQNSPHHPS